MRYCEERKLYPASSIVYMNQESGLIYVEKYQHGELIFFPLKNTTCDLIVEHCILELCFSYNCC